MSAREVSDLHALQVDRCKQRDVAVGRAVDAGRENVDVMAVLRERPAKCMHGSDRATVSKRRQIRWDNVKKAQKLIHQFGCRRVAEPPRPCQPADRSAPGLAGSPRSIA